MAGASQIVNLVIYNQKVTDTSSQGRNIYQKWQRYCSWVCAVPKRDGGS